MKVIDERKPTTTRFSEIKVGGCFIYEEELCMRMADTGEYECNVVCLQDGIPFSMDSEDEVEVVTAYITMR